MIYVFSLVLMATWKTEEWMGG